MPFQKGQSGNPRGRPRKGASLRELLRRHPLKDKRRLIATAYRLALAGDVRWAEWIAKHSGEGAARPADGAGPAVGAAGRTPIREVVIERSITTGDGTADSEALPGQLPALPSPQRRGRRREA